MPAYTDPATLPVDVRQKLLLMRTALIIGDQSEAHHWLYAIACPGFACLDPYAALEGRRCECGPHGTDGEPLPTVEAMANTYELTVETWRAAVGKTEVQK